MIATFYRSLICVLCYIAGGSTFLIEFGMLSYYTSDMRYYNAAKKASLALWEKRYDLLFYSILFYSILFYSILFYYSSTLGLVGNHINVQTGDWTVRDAGVGS